jgi:hypothetical protein
MSIENMRDGRVISSVLGVEKKEFEILALQWEITDIRIKKEELASGKRKRLYGGVKGVLDTAEKKLFYALYYLKHYPTFDHMGFLFGFDGGDAYYHVKNHLKVLKNILIDLKKSPATSIKSMDEFLQMLEKNEIIIVDAYERLDQRKKNAVENRRFYSGKKKLIQ